MATEERAQDNDGCIRKVFLPDNGQDGRSNTCRLLFLRNAWNQHVSGSQNTQRRMEGTGITTARVTNINSSS